MAIAWADTLAGVMSVTTTQAQSFDWGLFVQIFAALGTAAAAIAAFWSANETRRTSQGQLVVALIEARDSHDLMRAQARIMFQASPEAVGDSLWAKQEMARFPLDDAIARVTMLVQRLRVLQELGLIQKKHARKLLNENMVGLMRHYWEFGDESPDYLYLTELYDLSDVEITKMVTPLPSESKAPSATTTE